MFHRTLESVFKQHYSRLVLFAMKYVGDQAEAEDIVQESFSKFWIKKDTLLCEDENVVRSFLYQTVRNEALNFLKHQSIVKRFEESPREEGKQESTLTYIIQSEVIAQIHAAIQELPESCKAIALQLFVEGKKYQEVAEELSISVNTVKSQRRRALELLRPKLEQVAYFVLLNCCVDITE